MITKFLEQDEELEAFITGAAGTGKTTNLASVIAIIDEMKLNYQVVAYTHKAKDVLIDKLPENTPISTLHSWLKKRPGINEKAQHMRALLTSKQYGKPEPLELLIVDEFSFVGEADYFSIGELQDPNELEDQAVDGKIPKLLKVLYIGDLNQLSPIDGPPAVIPIEPFWTQLTKIYRQDSEHLQTTLSHLVKMIEGDVEMAYLYPNEDFRRQVNIDNVFRGSPVESKVMLAWTNKAVQAHNATIQGYDFPKSGDLVLNSTLKETFIWECTRNLTDDMELTTAIGIINKDTKYNPFKELKKNKDIVYAQAEDGRIIPCIFGYQTNKLIRNRVGKALTVANKTVASETTRKNAYKAYKNLNDYVNIVDFTHCQTIHKSQGQEYEEVYVDSADLALCKDKKEMLKLLYVALSRAKDKIYLNN